MIAEIIPAVYDAEGKKVFRPFDRRKGPQPTFPIPRQESTSWSALSFFPSCR
jgi:hypothetical protein